MKSWSLIAGFCSLAAVFSSANAADFSKFKVADASGDCQVKAGDAKAFEKANLNSEYAAGSIGKTGSDGKMKVEFDPQTRFRLFPDSEVTIFANANNPRFQKIVDLRLKKGGVEVGLKNFPKDYQMKVQTPTAVCGAMGTVFSVESDENGKARFECSEHSIKVVPRDYDNPKEPEQNTEYEGFTATVPAGAFVDASVKPGKENAVSQLKTGGKGVDLNLGKSDSKTYHAEAGTDLLIAEQQSPTSEVAFQVNSGNLDGNGKGKYILDGKEVMDVSKAKDGPEKFDAYVTAAKKESTVRAKVARKQNQGQKDEDLEKELEKAADEATQRRKELFEYRDEIRRTVRQGLDSARGGGRPTTIPR